MLAPDEIRAKLLSVQTRIAAACARAERAVESVTLIAVTKTFPAAAADAAIAAGVHELGENRVQEAREKIPRVSGRARWHLIGHLQSNKAKDAVQLFDVIQTVDSLGLAEKISHAASAAGKRQEVLLQINIGLEEQKSGVAPEDAARLLEDVRALESLEVRGLMTIPPIGSPDDAHRHFRKLRELRDRLGLAELSMGMTDDFEIAIEEGATMIRVGRAIFGSRG
ncbi:MAG: YggS family pyridoxal phosphate-dependent enzyme [Thermoanaerobaculia bacterium]